MPTESQGTLVVNEISEDNGSTWKVIVCETDSQISGTSTANETPTKCGTYTSVENNAMTVSGSGVAGGDLSTNQVSYQRLAQLRQAKTKIKFRRQNAASGTLTAGEITYAMGDAYVTEATETSNEGEVTQFNWAMTFTGEVDLTPGS